MTTYRLGFTGTRTGMTYKQIDSLREILLTMRPDEFHHGDCLGADTEAHLLAENRGHIKVVIHPPNQAVLRGWCRGDEVRNSKPYLDRNKAIVDSCDLLIAAPAEETEQRRSGTWATIRYALQVGKPVLLLERWTGDRKMLGKDAA